MINNKNLSNQPVENVLRAYDKIWKMFPWQGIDYTTGCLLDVN